MTISDLKAMYDYYEDIRVFYRKEMRDLPYSSEEYRNSMETALDAELKANFVGKRLNEEMEKAYQILKSQD